MFPDSVQGIPRAEQARIKKEFDQFSHTARDGRLTQEQRDEAMRQSVLRALKLGLDQSAIEKAIGRPLYKLNLQAPQ